MDNQNQKYYIISCHVLWRELCYYASRSKNTFNFYFLKQGLHDTPEILRQELQKAIDQVSVEYSAILLGYGLCSKGLEGIQAKNTKLVVMRGHDCITFLLGSKEKYADYFNRHPGTYWYSPGWIEWGFVPSEKSYNERKGKYIEKYGIDNADYLMKLEETWLRNYKNCAYVDLGVGETEDYSEFTKSCSKWLNWNCDQQKGDPNLIINFLNGDWNDKDFLIVKPGETIFPSYDDRIIESK